MDADRQQRLDDEAVAVGRVVGAERRAVIGPVDVEFVLGDVDADADVGAIRG